MSEATVRALFVFGVAGLLGGCGGADPSPGGATSGAASPAPVASAGSAALPASAASAPPWTDAERVGAAISTHVAQAYQAGVEYQVTDGGSSQLAVVLDEVGDAAGRVQTWPTGPAEGYAQASARTRDGRAVQLLYALRWDAGQPRMDGGKGGFVVTGAEVLKLAEGPERYRFEQVGSYWRRVDAP